MPGFGEQDWGSTDWGGTPDVTGLELLNAVAVAENVVRLYFSVVPYVSGLLDPFDGADPSHYAVAAVGGTVGYDNNPARAVAAVLAATTVDYAGVVHSDQIDVVLDRPMSPYPAQYTIAVAGLATSGLVAMVPAAPATLYGVLKHLHHNSHDRAVPTRDFANPQSLVGVEGTTIGLTTSAFAAAVGGGYVQLGAFVADDSGDYASEQGIAALMKRLYRRAMSKTGAFAHLPKTYGAGLGDQVKRLGTGAVRNHLCATLQTQFSLEPEVAACVVRVRTDPANPAITRFSAYIKTRQGVSRRLDMPFNTVTGQVLAPSFGARLAA